MWRSRYLNCWALGMLFVAMGTSAKELQRLRLKVGWGERNTREDIKIKKAIQCCKTRLNPHTDGSEPYIATEFTKINLCFPINLRKIKYCWGTVNFYISGKEPKCRCHFHENFSYAWLGSHYITFICLDVGDINSLMNIHGVWLIKLIVLQKCLHFQGQFFSSLISAWYSISDAFHELLLLPLPLVFSNF